MPYGPPCRAYFWGIYFANMGGGGGQNYFHAFPSVRYAKVQPFLLCSDMGPSQLIADNLVNLAQVLLRQFRGNSMKFQLSSGKFR